MRTNTNFPRRSLRSGFTLVEAAVVLTMSTALMLSVLGLMQTAQTDYSSSTANLQATMRAQTAITRVCDDLRRTGTTVLAAGTMAPVDLRIAPPVFNLSVNPATTPSWVPPTPPAFPYTATYAGGVPRTGRARPSPLTTPPATGGAWPNALLQCSLQRGWNPSRPGASGWSRGVWYEMWPERVGAGRRLLRHPVLVPADTDQDGLSGTADQTPPSRAIVYALQEGLPRGDYLVTFHTWNLVRVEERDNSTFTRETIATGIVYLSLVPGRAEQGTTSRLVSVRVVAAADDRLSDGRTYSTDLSERVEKQN